MSLCHYFPNCNACSEWNTSYTEQKDRKIVHLKQLLETKNLKFSNIEFKSAGEHSLRHKTDFVYVYKNNEQRFGFYTKDREVLDISTCLQMSPELQKVFDDFRKLKIETQNGPVLKGSVRLRVGPKGQKGCWLDFSNADIKNLLEDGQYLKNLIRSGFIVEIGQKNKRLVFDSTDALKLKNTPPEIWFQTKDRNQSDLLLHSHISSFTQPSWISGSELVKCVLDWIDNTYSLNILEFGAGIGFFTSAFLADGHKVTTLELEESATECLFSNIPANSNRDLLNVKVGDFHRLDFNTNGIHYDLAFVNPARAGLKKFTQKLNELRVNKIIYVSCFPDSMVEDLKSLSSHYNLRNIIIVDQFPQTRHYETCVLLEKIQVNE